MSYMVFNADIKTCVFSHSRLPHFYVFTISLSSSTNSKVCDGEDYFSLGAKFSKPISTHLIW